MLVSDRQRSINKSHLILIHLVVNFILVKMLANARKRVPISRPGKYTIVISKAKFS